MKFNAPNPDTDQTCRGGCRGQFHMSVVLFLLTMSCFLGKSAIAQSGGLKLGTDASESSSPTLDLGASAAPADRAEPAPGANSAPAAGSAPSAGSAPTAQGGGQAPGAPQAGAISSTVVGAWEVACPPAGVGCAMAQIGNDEAGTPVLEMVIRKLDEPLEVGERTAIAVLDVITPLGVVLTEGLTVTIDGGREESAPFQVCTEQGCLVREPIDDDLISRFKAGNSTVVGVIAANQGAVKATLSLSGFTKAYNGLK